MPRSLSGVKSGVFDTLEVSETVQLSDLHTSGKIVAQDLETQGSFSHTGSTPAEFDQLTVGTSPANEGLLTVNGSIACGSISSTGLEAPLTFTLPDDSTVVYNGGTARAVTIPAPVSLPTFRSLTLKHGQTTVGTFDPVGATNASLVVPRSLTATLTSATTQTVNVNDSPSLVHSGFGLSLGTLASNTKVKVDVQMCLSNPTSSTEEFFVALTTSKTSHATNYVRKFAKMLKPDDLKIVRFSAMLTLSGTANIGLAVDTKDEDYGVVVQYGGDFPDVILTATLVDDATTTVGGG